MSIRKSVPTVGVSRWWLSGWAYVMPDFDNPDHSIIEWLGGGRPTDPAAEQLAADVTTEFVRAE